jgi:hypothetical protein
MKTSRRKRRQRERPLTRIPDDVATALSQLASATGWSDNEALAFMARAGWSALNSGGDKISAMRQVMTAAVAHHETEVAMRKRLAIAAEKLRSARKALGAAGGAS